MTRKKTILLVEDDVNLSELVKLRLEQENFNVTAVHDGVKMFSVIQKTKPDLIILDVMLPKIDGFKLCGLLKNYDQYKDVPVIIFTARSGLESKALAKEMGGDAYIQKPFDAKVLIEKIHDLLKRYQNRSSPTVI